MQKECKACEFSEYIFIENHEVIYGFMVDLVHVLSYGLIASTLIYGVILKYREYRDTKKGNHHD